MLNPLPPFKESPSQTAGPYVHIGLTPNFAEIKGVYASDLGAEMLTPDTVGERIAIAGRLIDGSGAPVGDAVVEIWQADAAGAHAAPAAGGKAAFLGFGRTACAPDGTFRFETIKPGPVPGPDGRPMAPHVSLWIVARGINIGLHTRMYFSDEEAANAECPVLARIAHKARVPTLIATRAEENGLPTYTFDIHLQGEKETVFFDI